MAEVRLQGVSKSFDQVRAVDNVDPLNIRFDSARLNVVIERLADISQRHGEGEGIPLRCLVMLENAQIEIRALP